MCIMPITIARTAAGSCSPAGAGGRFSNSNAQARIGSNVFSSGTRDEVGNLSHGSNTILYVGKLFTSDPAGNYDRFSYTINPTTLVEPVWDYTAEFDTGLNAVDTLWFRAGGEANSDFAVDMLRVGTN